MRDPGAHDDRPDDHRLRRIPGRPGRGEFLCLWTSINFVDANDHLRLSENQAGATPLHVACAAQAQVDIVWVLVESGSFLDEVPDVGLWIESTLCYYERL